ASGKASVFTADSLVVQRSTFPLATSTEYTSPALLALFTESARSCPLRCHRNPPYTPAGSFGSDTSFAVARSITCATLNHSSPVVNATGLPSCDKSNPSTSQGIFVVKNFVCFEVRSKYASLKNSESLSVVA